ncbi:MULTISPECIES: GNAT family N-acetyltransferase [Cryobacterium]|uniref:N-acetyltransferase n=1 Tax=Cryobacterium breve TaxID=1259258 RepID=A0ABY2IWI4_9MICO|nr:MULTISPECIES: GNAT family N-acetyltransferase [Cryobacterium]TFC93239.1 N-acetyltransferase [Cryobacterium sp. TmT3-12]TFC96380.1 N-acetyltransferase [Cryobacterium breve]
MVNPAHTVVIQINGEDVGLIAVRTETDSHWIEHFSLEPDYQGRGIGGAVLRQALDKHRDHRPSRLNVLRAGPARVLSERHGFGFDHEDAVDVFLVTAD